MADTDEFRSEFGKMAKVQAKESQSKSPFQICVLDETRPGTPLPTLPTEIWMLVIRNATAMPGFSPLAPSSTPASFLTPTHRQMHLDRYYSLMRQRSLLSLVSQQFHWMVNEVLFEFVWISRSSQAKSLAYTLLSQAMRWGFGACISFRRDHPDGRRGTCGDFIRRIRIETSSLQRCNPVDLRVILDLAPFIQIYEDHHGMRCNVLEEGESATSHEQLLYALVASSPNKQLKALTLTNYDDGSFHHSIGPILHNRVATASLQFLELQFLSASHRHSSAKPLTKRSHILAIDLPALHTLKVTLDNNTFLVLSNWEMPNLTSLSVLSADFSYASSGFSRFFEVHGASLHQLELGHSSSSIEEHYLTSPTLNRPMITLGRYCPNLKEFICSADAEWNWQNPDWIAPHVLLPSHPTLKLIGIRDLDKRIKEDLELSFALQHHNQNQDADSLFSLTQQMSSLIRREAFPALRYIRDLSPESYRLQRPLARVPNQSDTRVIIASVHFWKNMLEKCCRRGLWLESCDGMNVTMNELRRKGREVGLTF